MKKALKFSLGTIALAGVVLAGVVSGSAVAAVGDGSAQVAVTYAANEGGERFGSPQAARAS